MSVHPEDIKLEIKVEKSDVETQHENETGDKSMAWNLPNISDQDNIYTSALIKKEFKSEADSKSTHKNYDFVNFESIYIKEEKQEKQNVKEDDCVENYEQDLIDYPTVDCKSEISIEEHPLAVVKDESTPETETSQDGSTRRADAVFDADINKPNENFCENSRENKLYKQQYIDIKDLVDVHIRIHTGERPYECKLCKKTFTHRGTITNHMRKHTGERHHECEICKNKFTSRGRLNGHMLIHSNEKPHECEICKKSFAQKGALTAHMRNHTGEKPYECKICKKKFSINGHLNEHMRIHSGEKPYKCEICKKSFGHTGTLTIHKRIHTGEKPYQCEICKKTFARTGTLNIHMRIHSGEKPYECKICKKTFAHTGTINIHMRKHSGE